MGQYLHFSGRHHFRMVGTWDTILAEQNFFFQLFLRVHILSANIDNGAHGTEKLLLNTQVGEDFA